MFLFSNQHSTLLYLINGTVRSSVFHAVRIEIFARYLIVELQQINVDILISHYGLTLMLCIGQHFTSRLKLYYKNYSFDFFSDNF